VALDTLTRESHSPLSSIQWVSTRYLLSLAAVTPLSGWLTERFGSKRTWIASIALFAVGSALCALATSAGELIAFRILQGLGGGMLTPVGFTLIAQSAGPRRVGRALAAVGVPWPAGLMLASPAAFCAADDGASGVGQSTFAARCHPMVSRYSPGQFPERRVRRGCPAGACDARAGCGI
jgi:MFS family permease